MNQILNAQRLIQLSQFHPKLKNIWYLVAAATFSVCNEPQEIPKLYHYAMLLSNDNAHMYRFTLASQTIDLLRSELPMRKTLINENYQQPTFFQKQLTAKFREVILKTGPLAGLPRAINGLTMLKETTPDILVPHLDPIDPWEAAMGNSSPLSENLYEKEA
ncbi:YJR111C-like protein [Saccharomyces cerevisiae FostersO]|nr:YJR111C-like protein [Saccharomyces cerevisiae FostersO]